MYLQTVIIFILVLILIYLICTKRADPYKSPIPNVGSDDPSKLSIISYNIQMRPVIDDLLYRCTGIHTHKTDIIANKLPKILENFNTDIIVLSEAFSDKIIGQIYHHIKNVGYKYHTCVLNETVVNGNAETSRSFGIRKWINGGIIVFSKYPIIDQKELCFQNSAFVDKYSAKGAQYLKIDKLGKKYNIIATHMNASYDIIRGQTAKMCKGKTARYKQIDEISEFIDSINIPDTEPLIFAGDMNIDRYRDADEYKNMIDVLNMTNPPNQGYIYTYDQIANTRTQMNQGNRLLDYILYSKKHKKPVRSSSTINKLYYEGDVSDHYPVVGMFLFS